MHGVCHERQVSFIEAHEVFFNAAVSGRSEFDAVGDLTETTLEIIRRTVVV